MTWDSVGNSRPTSYARKPAESGSGRPEATTTSSLTHAQRQQARAILEAWVRWLARQNDPGCGYPRCQPFARGIPVIWEMPDSQILTRDDCEKVMLIVRNMRRDIQNAILTRYYYYPDVPRRGGLRAQAQYLGIAVGTLRDRLATAEQDLIYGLR